MTKLSTASMILLAVSVASVIITSPEYVPLEASSVPGPALQSNENT